MTYTHSATATAVGILICLAAVSGCNQTQSALFQNAPAPAAPLPAGAVAPNPGVSTTPPASAAPYVLSATSSGAFIDFSIYNLGEADLPVKGEDFAIISPENRQVVPYTRGGAVIDLPQPPIVKPNATLHGRAVFNAVKNPVGKRLVFKPDVVGTFADINRQ
jgi:hypothetical protein